MGRWWCLAFVVVTFCGCSEDEEPRRSSRSGFSDIAKSNADIARSKADVAKSNDDAPGPLNIGKDDKPGNAGGGNADDPLAALLKATPHARNPGARPAAKPWYQVAKTELGSISRNRVTGTPIVFSRDFRRYAYWIRSGGRYAVVIDGRKSDQKVDHFPGKTAFANHDQRLGRIVFSRDGKHVAYEAADRTAKKQFIVLDGKKLTEHDQIVPNTLIFSPDGRSLAYSASNDTRRRGSRQTERHKFICVRGTRSVDIPVIRVVTYPHTYSSVADNLAFDPAGGRLVFVTHRIRQFGGDFPIVAIKTFDVDAIPRALKNYDTSKSVVRHLRFTPDGKHVVYAVKRGEEWRMTVDGKEGAGFADVAPPVISADGSRMLYAAKDGESWTVQHDGRTGEEFAEVDPKIVVSKDGRHTAFLFRQDRFKPWTLAWDGVARQFLATVERGEKITAFLQLAKEEQKNIVREILKKADNRDELLKDSKRLLDECVFELEKRRQKAVVPGSLALSPGGRYLAWRSSDGEVWVNRWKIAKTTLLKGQPRLHFIDERHIGCVEMEQGRLNRVVITVSSYPDQEKGSLRWYPWPVGKTTVNIGSLNRPATIADLSPKVDPKQVAAQSTAEQALNGTWTLSSMSSGAPGNRRTSRTPASEIWTFKNGRLTKRITRIRGTRKSTSTEKSTYTINANTDPIAIDLIDRKAVFSGQYKGIYKIDRNTLTMALSPGQRPTKLVDANSRHRVYVLKRENR